MTPKQVMSLSWKWGQGLVLPLAGALLLALAAPASQAAGLRFDVFLGYNNLVPDEGWFPITCEIQNDGPGFNGIIEVNASDIGRGQVRRVKVDLPTGTLKRVVIPVFTAARSWDVRLLDERGKVRDEQIRMSAKLTSHELPLVAGLCRTVQGLPTFPELPMRIQFQSSSTYGAARLQAETFPDNPLAMESIDLLYLNSAKALDLKEPQAQALRAWLQNGGHLVVGVEQISDITGNRWLKELMPCDLTDARVLNDHAQLQQWLRSGWSSARFGSNPSIRQLMPGQRMVVRPRAGPGASIQPAPVPPNTPAPPSDTAGAIPPDDPEFEAAPLPMLAGTLQDGGVLIGDEAAPLAITAERGRGKITVLTFSPEREPFVSWKNRGWFWAKLAEIPLARLTSSENTPNMSRLGSDGIYGSMIDSKQVRRLPLPWLLALLVAYLAVIGPLDQYWLKKINRQMLTWVTFPLYVVAFSGLIYWIGYHLRAGELEWNEMNVVDVLPDLQPNLPSAVLRGETYVSIYSPVNAHYPLGSVQPFATLRGEYGGNYGGGSESSGAAIVQTGNWFEAEAFVPVWTSQLYVSEWLQRAEPVPLSMTVTKQGEVWSATIENGTDRVLPRARLVLGGRVYDVSGLPAHQTKTFTFNSGAGVLLENFANQHMNSFATAVQSRRQNFGNNQVAISDAADGAMAASFLSKMNLNPQQGGWGSFEVFRSRDLGRFAGAGHAILLAWDPGHSPAAPLNRFAA
ncbi:MAG: hypothetical protein ABSG04_15265, partial [Verrucomicrobiota bacterium]